MSFIFPSTAINIKTFGAKGDGVTDDTSAIQASINAAGPNGTVYFPATPNYYKVTHSGNTPPFFTHSIVLPSNITLYGDGPKSLISTPDDTAIFKVFGVSGVLIKGLALKGDYTVSTVGAGIGVFINQSSNVEVSDCTIYNLSNVGVYCTGGNAIKSSNIRVKNNQFDTIAGGAVAFSGNPTDTSTDIISDFQITGNVVTNTTVYTALYVQYGATRGVIANNVVIGTSEHGILVDSASGVSVTGNYVESCTNDGICIAQTDSLFPTHGITVTGNVCTGCGSYSPTQMGGIGVTGHDSNLHDIVLSSNSVYANLGHGIVLLPTSSAISGPTGFLITGNTVYNNVGDGICGGYQNSQAFSSTSVVGNHIHNNSGNGVYGYGISHWKLSDNRIHTNALHGVYMNVASYNHFDGNEIYNNDSANSSAYSGIFLDAASSFNTVQGNKCTNYVSTTQKYGVVINDVSDTSNFISHNYLSNNKTADILDSGTSTIKFLTSSSGTLTLSALTANKALTTGTGGVLAVSPTTDTELAYVNGVTSAIQTQIDAKAPLASPTFTGTITTPLANSSAVATDGSHGLVASSTTSTELGYVHGVTSAIQTQINTKAPTASPTFTGTIGTPLTISSSVVTDGSGKLAVSSTTAAELGYVHGVTSAIQTQLGTKAPLASPTFSGTITTPLAVSSAVVTDSGSVLTASSTTATELGYVHGVTSAIQTQLNVKAPTAAPSFTSTILNANAITINSSSAVDCPLAFSGIFVMRDTTNGGTCLALYENGSAAIVSTNAAGATLFVTGAPASAQVQISSRAGGHGISLLGGSSRNGAVINVAVLACQ